MTVRRMMQREQQPVKRGVPEALLASGRVRDVAQYIELLGLPTQVKAFDDFVIEEAARTAVDYRERDEDTGETLYLNQAR